MANYFVTTSYDESKNKDFFTEAEWEMEVLDVNKISPASKNIWEIIEGRENHIIIDARNINNSIATLLYVRYMKAAEKTFLLLTEQQEKKYVWGYGAGVYEPHYQGNANRLLRLWRDIKFFFEQGDGKKTEEPVQEFLESYWIGKEFKEQSYDSDTIDFEQVEELENNRGEMLTERLKTMMLENDVKRFKQELKLINGNCNLDYKDYMVIGNLCEEMELKLYRVSIMEKGNSVWKGTIPDLLFGLIDAYIDSPNIAHKEKALKLANEYFGICTAENGDLVIGKEQDNIIIEENYIKSLLNAYIVLERFDELSKLVEFEDYFIEHTKDESLHALFLRNRAICKKEKGNNDEALVLFQELYKQEPSENTVNLIVNTYESLHNYDKAASLQLILTLRDYGELDALMRLTKIILKNSLIFSQTKGWSKITNITELASKQIIPLLMFVFSFERNQNKQEIVYDIYRFIEKEQDLQALDFFEENKDRLAYIWSNFKELSTDNNRYDMQLVEYIQSEYQKVQQNIVNIDDLIRNNLTLD